MHWRNLSLILCCTFALGACAKMYFPEPRPSIGQTVRKLPHFLKGSFFKKQKIETESGEFLEIKRISDQHCKIYTYYAFSKDSLGQMLKSLNTDSTRAVLKGNTLIYTTRDSVEKTVFNVDNDFFYTPKDTLCEINLSEATFVDDFPDGEAKKLLLKKSKDAYYLSVLEKNIADAGKDYWFVIKFDFLDSEMAITNTSLQDSTFSKKLDYYNKIASIEKIGSNQYLCKANDEQFFRLFEEKGLFEKEVWQPVSNGGKQVLLYIAGLVVVALGVIGVVILVWVMMKRKV